MPFARCHERCLSYIIVQQPQSLVSKDLIACGTKFQNLTSDSKRPKPFQLYCASGEGAQSEGPLGRQENGPFTGRVWAFRMCWLQDVLVRVWGLGVWEVGDIRQFNPLFQGGLRLKKSCFVEDQSLDPKAVWNVSSKLGSPVRGSWRSN